MTDDRKPPRIPDAPGLVWKPRKTGWQAGWQARTDIVRRRYPIKFQALWSGVEPTESQRAWISDQCRRYQADMLSWARGAIEPVNSAIFDGSLHSLIECYKTDLDSTYRKLRFRTRENYDTLLRRITRDHGLTPVADIKARTVLRWHEDWAEGGKIAMGHGMVGMLRTLFSFGATILDSTDCRNAKVLMHDMRFKMAPPRKERMTADQAVAIRRQAHLMGLHSIALAQAFQFELMLRQKDVIGEWVPQNEKGASDVLAGGQKWLRGIRWSEIDQNLILRHTTSKRGKDIEVNLRLAPMVIEEFDRLGFPLPTSGPVIISEASGICWTNYEFRRIWRKVAVAAGIPASVYNMDSRAGGISEATDAGADLESVRHAATHSDIGMTQKYSRGSVDKVATVMRLREAHRNKK